jgi:hypothetical protein
MAEPIDFMNVKPSELEIICPKHGQHNKYIHSSILGHDGYWCMLCWLESLGEPLEIVLQKDLDD